MKSNGSPNIYTFRVIIEPDGKNAYHGYAPSLPGCHTCGTSHLIMAHPDGRRASIPIHFGKDIPEGTLKGILKDIEISTEQFIALLKK